LLIRSDKGFPTYAKFNILNSSKPKPFETIVYNTYENGGLENDKIKYYRRKRSYSKIKQLEKLRKEKLIEYEQKREL
jgi:hypothetical protein